MKKKASRAFRKTLSRCYRRWVGLNMIQVNRGCGAALVDVFLVYPKVTMSHLSPFGISDSVTNLKQKHTAMAASRIQPFHMNPSCSLSSHNQQYPNFVPLGYATWMSSKLAPIMLNILILMAL